MTEFPEDSPRAREDREAEDWLRSELDFLRGAERRILRRTRVREEAWRVAAVVFILAMFACCWYLAALYSGPSAGSSCRPADRPATRTAVGRVLPAARARAAAGSGVALSAHGGCS